MASAAENRAGQPRAVDRASDLFVSGIRTIEEIGNGMVRISYFVNVKNDEGNLEAAPADHSLVIPLAAIADGIGKAMMALGRTVIARENEILVRH